MRRVTPLFFDVATMAVDTVNKACMMDNGLLPDDVVEDLHYLRKRNNEYNKHSTLFVTVSRVLSFVRRLVGVVDGATLDHSPIPSGPDEKKPPGFIYFLRPRRQMFIFVVRWVS